MLPNLQRRFINRLQILSRLRLNVNKTQSLPKWNPPTLLKSKIPLYEPKTPFSNLLKVNDNTRIAIWNRIMVRSFKSLREEEPEGWIVVNYFYLCGLYMTILTVVAFFALCKILSVRQFCELYLPLKSPDGELVLMKKRLSVELEQSLKDPKYVVESEKRYTHVFGLGDTLKPSIESSLRNKAGAVFLFPITMNLMLPNQSEEENDADLRQFCRISQIDYDSLQADERQELYEALQYSPMARRFMREWMFQSAVSTLEPSGSSAILIFCPMSFCITSYMVFNDGNPVRQFLARFHSIPKNSIFPTLFGALLAYTVAWNLIPFVAPLHYKFGMYNLIDEEAAKSKQMARELIEGGKEFFERNRRIEKLVRELTRDKNNAVLVRQTNQAKLLVFDYPDSYQSILDEKLRQL